MSLIINGILVVILLTAEILYIRVARQWGLIDRPNERSLHTDTTTVRGGGVIFWLAVCCVFVYSGFILRWFFLGLTLVAAISFLDDVRSVPKRYRLICQVIGWSLAIVQLFALPAPLWLLAVLMIVGLSSMNAFNFMDGINGMTAFYSLVTIGTLWYWFVTLPTLGAERILLAETKLILPAVFMALLVFCYFNARKQAVCFAGDVGSVSVGFIIGYSLLCLVWITHSLLPLMLLTVYSLDTSLTLGQRLWQKQNILEPHRQHLFQVLVREAKWPQLRVAGLYATIQLNINVLILWAMNWQNEEQWWLCSSILGVTTGIYCFAKWRLAILTLKNNRLQT